MKIFLIVQPARDPIPDLAVRLGRVIKQYLARLALKAVDWIFCTGIRVGLMSLGTLLFTRFRGRQVGQDAFGNRYYEERRPRQRQGSLMKARRWVLYVGAADGSKVPPLWNAWLHHSSDEVPGDSPERYDWQKAHRPNLTGTALAYRPPGSALTPTASQDSNKDSNKGYESWQPR